MRVEIPGKIARHLGECAKLGEAERRALRRGRTVRRGQGYSRHVTAPPDVHHALLAAAAMLSAEGASAAGRQAYGIYADRLNGAVASATITTPAAVARNIGNPHPSSSRQPRSSQHAGDRFMNPETQSTRTKVTQTRTEGLAQAMVDLSQSSQDRLNSGDVGLMRWHA